MAPVTASRSDDLAGDTVDVGDRRPGRDVDQRRRDTVAGAGAVYGTCPASAMGRVPRRVPRRDAPGVELAVDHVVELRAHEPGDAVELLLDPLDEGLVRRALPSGGRRGRP